jgi:putative transcriptional regulator
MNKHRNDLIADLMEAAEEMVAIEKGKREAARVYHYEGNVLVEITEGGRIVWSLDTAEVPEEIAAAAQPKAIREALRQTQAGFADLLRVSVGTLRGWEQGRRTPQGPAETLLRIAASNPGAVHNAASAAQPGQKPRRRTRDKA